jgi:hypothetical protein
MGVILTMTTVMMTGLAITRIRDKDRPRRTPPHTLRLIAQMRRSSRSLLKPVSVMFQPIPTRTRSR